MKPLTRCEQAVLEAYQSEAVQLCRRKALYLTKHELSERTGFPPGQCCNARAGLIAKKIIRKMGYTVPMKVELL